MGGESVVVEEEKVEDRMSGSVIKVLISVAI